MKKRPLFSAEMTIEEFERHYWYKTELQKICRIYKLPVQGTKAELQQYIKDFLEGRKPLNKRADSEKIRKKVRIENELTPATKLISGGFKFDKRARSFFADYFKVEKFSFTKEMAAALRKAEAENNLEASVSDLIKVYKSGSKSRCKGKEKDELKGDAAYFSAEEKTYEWNNFVKDFCKDENTKKLKGKMKAAAFLWAKVRDNPGTKKYSRELLNKYMNELMKIR